MDYSDLQDWEIAELAKDAGLTVEEWKAAQDSMPGKIIGPPVAAQPTGPEKEAAGESSSATTSLGSSETDGLRYVQIGGRNIYEDDYMKNYAGKKTGRGTYPNTFEKYAKVKKVEIQIEPLAIEAVDVVASYEGQAAENVKAAKAVEKKLSNVTVFKEKVAIATKYFNLIEQEDGSFVPQVEGYGMTTKVDFSMGGLYGGGVPTFEGDPNIPSDDYDISLKRSLGPTKYAQWKKLTEAAGGKVTAQDIKLFYDDLKIDGAFEQGHIYNKKTKVAEISMRDIPEYAQSDIQRYMGNEEIKTLKQEKFVTALQDERDYYELTGRKLISPQTVAGRTYTPTTYIDYSDIIDTQNKNLNAQFEILTEQNTSLESRWKEMNEARASFEPQIKEIDEELKAFGLVNEYSPEETIDAYNALITKRNAITADKAFKYYEENWEQLATETEAFSTKLNETLEANKEILNQEISQKAALKAYDHLTRAAIVWEEFVLGGFVALAGQTAEVLADLETVKRLSPGLAYSLEQSKRVGVDYNKALAAKRERSLPSNLTYEDVENNGASVGDYIAEGFVNNSPSIVLAMAPTGIVGLGAKGAAGMVAMARAGKIVGGVFGIAEAGSYLRETDLAMAGADENITRLKEELENTEGTIARGKIIEQIEEQENLLTLGVYQRSFNAVAYGAIASYAERLGSIGWLAKYSKYNKYLGYDQFLKLTGGKATIAKQISKNLAATARPLQGVIVEEFEETATQIGQNIMDITVGGFDKSLIEGLDVDFFLNVAISSFAMQGPSVGSNIYNSVGSMLRTSKEAKENAKLVDELIDVQDALDGDKLTADQRKEYRVKRRVILESMAINDAKQISKASQLNKNDISRVAEIDRQQRVLRREAEGLGYSEATTSSRRNLDRVQEEYDKLEAERNEILGKPERMAKKAVEGSQDPKALFNFQNYLFNLDVARVMGKDVRVIHSIEQIENLDLTEQEKAEITAAFGTENVVGANAMEINGKVFVFEDNIRNRIMQGGVEAIVASVSPLHEVGHQQTAAQGVVRDKKLVGASQTVIDGIFEEMTKLYAQGKISQDVMDNFEARVAMYKTEEGVNVDELIQLITDYTNAGIIEKNSLGKMWEMKSFVNNIYKLFFPGQDVFFKVNTAEDVFSFIDSWTSKAMSGSRLTAPEDREGSDLSKGLLDEINGLVPDNVQTQEDFFARSVFNPIYNDGNLHPAISNYIRSRSTSKEEAQKIIESVADRLINFNPAATRKAGDAKVTLGEFIFANVNFGKLDARKALFEESQERSMTESTDTQEARQLTAQETTTVQAEKPTYKTILQRRTFSEDLLTVAKQKVLSAVRVLKTRIDAPVSKNVTVTPLMAEIKKALGKQIDIDIKKEMGGLKDGQLRKFLLKNKAAILENMTTTWLMTAMPNAIQKQVGGVWTSDWKGKKIDRETVNTDNAGRTSGAEMARRLPKASTRMSDADFLSNFFNEDGSLIRGRKESLAKAMSEELAIELIKESLTDPNSEIAQALIANQERQGVENAEAMGPEFNRQAERGNVKFSQGVEKINREFNPKFDLELQGQNQGNALLAIHSLAAMDDLRTEKGQDAYIEDLKKYLFPLMPKEFWFGPGGGSVFTSSSKLMGGKSKSFPKEKRDAMWNRWREKVKELSEMSEENFGKPVGGIDSFQVKSYTTLFRDVPTIKKSIANGDLVKFNNQVSKIHRAMWTRFAEAVQRDKNAARAAMKFMHHGVNNMSHPQRMGAQFVGYSEDFIAGKETGTFEHAMPNISAYTYLMDAALRGADFNAAYNAVIGNYKLIALSKKSDDKLTGRYKTKMPENWTLLENSWWERYFNPDVFANNGGIDPNTILTIDGRPFGEAAGIKADGTMLSPKAANFSKGVDQEALRIAQDVMEDTPTRKTTPRAVFMVGGPGAGKTNVGKGMKLGRRGFKVVNQDIALEPMKEEAGLPANEQEYTKEQRSMRAKLGAKARKAAEEKMAKYTQMRESMVVDGTGASYNATMKKINALREAGYEVSIVFANTSKAEAVARNKARAERALPNRIVEKTWEAVQESAKLYKEEFGDNFYELNTNELKLGEDLPQKFLDKLYQDLEVSQANYSKGLSDEFNNIIERKTGVESFKSFSRIQAQMRGKNKGRFKFFVAPSAEDFRGLVHYAFSGKGKQGEADMAWFEEKLMIPYFKGIAAIDAMRQQIKRDFAAVKKQFREEYKLLGKKIDGSTFTYDHALRVYMWNRQGVPVEGLSKRDKKLLLDAIAKNPELVSFADALLVVSRKNEWPTPVEYWEGGTVLSDLNSMTEKIGRKKFLAEFMENSEAIFTEENMNKIEAVYGRRHREALEDSLYAMRNGTNRPSGASRQVNAWLNWINGSTGAIMFFNRRSALLQMLSFTNFINWSDNNPLKAAAAFGNQLQYWKDFAMIFNSDKLKERRGGLKQDVSDSELASVANSSKNSPQAILAYLLKIGFTPTQIADSMAIATGGAMFYRNRVNTYLKQGMDQKAAEEQAFLDFSMKSDEAQQSSDPALVSQQQRSVLGRLILAFANTPMQYTRLMKKAAQDLINGRGRPVEHISKIAYYGVIQNFIFSALQSALFSMFFDDEDEDENLTEAELEKQAKKEEQRVIRVLNSMMDTVLRGSGIYGAVASTIKNAIMEYYKQEEKGFMADHTYTLLAAWGISPPLQSKSRKIYSAIQTKRFEKDNVEARGWALTADGRLNLGPNWAIAGNVISGITNVPLDRVVDELKSISEALDSRNQMWQRIALALGWKTWDVGVRNEEADVIKTEAKEKRKEEGIEKAKKTREEKKKLEQEKQARQDSANYYEWEKRMYPDLYKNK